MRKTLLFLTTLIIFLTSCNFDTPENYFDSITLNTNSFGLIGSKDIAIMKESKKAKSLKVFINGVNNL
ncbi:hypothetical protein GCM10022393_42330 [Aquimarina addita]|uniref:Uncharacterized protein n=1 Tax=Aquimarina addita TaxID=870485 RepID=A0ABP6UV19_9FLAO